MDMSLWNDGLKILGFRGFRGFRVQELGVSQDGGPLQETLGIIGVKRG